MSVDLQSIETQLRASMCPSCTRYTADHRCSLPDDRECSLFRNLDKIVDIVRRTQSERVSDYELPLRESVCSACHHEDDHGCCPIRDDVDCALDAYFPMIIEAIEEGLEGQRRARASQRA